MRIRTKLFLTCVITMCFFSSCLGSIPSRGYAHEWRYFDFELSSNELLVEESDVERSIEIKEGSFNLHDIMDKDLESIGALLELHARYRVKYADQEVMIVFSPGQRGNGLLYIPVSGNKYRAIKIYDEHDDGIIFNPRCGEVVISKTSEGKLMMSITIHVESTSEPGEPCEPDMLNIHCTEKRCFILTSKGYFEEIPSK